MDELISTYTVKDAIRDGVLLPLMSYLTEYGLTKNARWYLRQLVEEPAKFNVGDVVITTNAAKKVSPEDVLCSLVRHQSGDWGDVDEDDWRANQNALEQEDGRIFSAYGKKSETRIWIITEWNRVLTTVLLPEDY